MDPLITTNAPFFARIDEERTWWEGLRAEVPRSACCNRV